MKTIPRNVTVFEYEDAEFNCSTDLVIPVNWEFTNRDGDHAQIYSAGVLTYALADRFSLDISAVGGGITLYRLFIRNVTMADSGDYICLDDAGFGPDVVTVELAVLGKYISILAKSYKYRIIILLVVVGVCVYVFRSVYLSVCLSVVCLSVCIACLAVCLPVMTASDQR